MQILLTSEMLKRCLAYENYVRKESEILPGTFLKHSWRPGLYFSHLNLNIPFGNQKAQFILKLS